MSRLAVVMASRKLVRIWSENLLFQLFSVHSQKGSLNSCFKKIFGSVSKGKRDRDQKLCAKNKRQAKSPQNL